MLLGEIEEDRIKEIEIMDKIKDKAVELLLGIISKRDFEMILYEKAKTENLLKNRLLFDLVNINYRLDYFKEKILKIYEGELDRGVFIIFKVNFYCEKIINSEVDSDKIKWFEKALNLFSYDEDYDLIWSFVELSDRLGFIYMKYESQKNIVEDINLLALKVLEKFKEAKTINEKYNVLEEGVQIEYKVNKKWYEFWK